MKPQILDLFINEEKISFSSIQKKLKIRSNKLAYHLKKLLSAGVLIKNKELYSLSSNTEPIIPYLSQKRATIPVILIKIGTNNKVFLCQRKKRPFKEYLGLPGGRLLVGEEIKEGAKRIMKEKFNIDVKIKSIQSINLEHVKKNGKTVYSFLLFLVEADTKNNITLLGINRYKKSIIKSDYIILKNKKLKLDIKTILSKE